MAQLINKENIVISTGTYMKDGAEKHRYKAIGELITMQGDDGSTYQFGEMWGPTGSTNFKVYDQQDRNAQQPQQPQAPQMQQPMQQQYQQQQQPQQQYQPTGGFQGAK